MATVWRAVRRATSGASCRPHLFRLDHGDVHRAGGLLEDGGAEEVEVAGLGEEVGGAAGDQAGNDVRGRRVFAGVTQSHLLALVAEIAKRIFITVF